MGPGRAGRERDRHGLAALAVHHKSAVAALEAELFDVGAQRFRDAQPVERQQRAQRMVRERPKTAPDLQF